MNSEQLEIIQSNRLFAGCDADTLRLREYGQIMSVPPGTAILPHTDTAPRLIILIKGHAAVYSGDSARKVLLRFASSGDAVGVAGIFTPELPDTRVVSCGDGDTEFYSLTRDEVGRMLINDSDGVYRDNLLSFLAGRIAFLNRRISCVTSGSAERRLAVFLASLPEADGKIRIDMSMKALSHALDIGRASLYRAFDSLTESGIIRRDSGTVTVLDRDAFDNLIALQ